MTSSLNSVLGYVFLFFSSILSASAGVGGGSVNVALFVEFFGLDFHTASGLSLCTLMGNYLFQVIINIDKSHPNNPKRSVIYWEAVLVLLPAELAGSNVGVLLTEIFPDTILYILAIAVSLFAITVTFGKGCHYYEIECLSATDAERVQLIVSPGGHHLGGSGGSGSSGGVYGTHLHAGNSKPQRDDDADSEHGFRDDADETETVDASAAGLSALDSLSSFGKKNLCGFIFGREKKNEIVYPTTIILVIVVAWALYCFCYVIMKEFDYCTLGYDITLGVLFVILVIEITWGLWYVLSITLMRKNNSRSSLLGGGDDESGHGSSNSEFSVVIQLENTTSWLAKGDINWIKDGTIFMPCMSFIVGILSALLGFGGGELIAPVLLHMKVLPHVTSATTSMLSFFNTSSSVIHYLVLGDIPVIMGCYVFLIGAVAGVIGRLAALYIVERYNRPSIFAFALVVVMMVSLGMYFADLVTEPLDFSKTGSLCSSD